MIVAQDKRQPPFTRDEFAALWASDMPTRDIALRAGRSTTNVQDWAKRFKLPPRPRSSNPAAAQLLTVSEEAFSELWNKGVPVLQMAKQIGMTKAGIEKYVKRLGLPNRHSLMDQRLPLIEAEFRRMWFDRNVTCRVMGLRLGVHRSTISVWARTLGLPAKPLPFASAQFVYEEGPLPGDPTPEEIAERAAECRARRELAKAQAEW